MDDLTTWKNQNCTNCKKKYEFLQNENLLFGFKETSLFCNDCYYVCLDKLVKFARELQNRKFFFGSANKQEDEQEMKKYKQIR
jgi:hypothetical protein